MSWFRKDLPEELVELIKKLGVAEIKIHEDWKLTEPRKFKNIRRHLEDLENIDLKIVYYTILLHKHNRDNPALSQLIIARARQLKGELEKLMGLTKLSTEHLPQDKIELLGNIIKYLGILLRKEIQEERLVRFMSIQQVRNLGIEVEHFYCAIGLNSLKRLFRGKGVWPDDWDRANLGIGLYVFDDFATAEKYKIVKETQLRNMGKSVPIHIVRITFSKYSLNLFRKEGKEMDLRVLTPKDYNRFMDKYSSYAKKNVDSDGKLKRPFLHKYFHVIAARAVGIEHYFRPECLEEAIFEKVA